MTKSERFVLDRKNNWKKLEEIIRKAKNSSLKRLSLEEVRDFPDLYRHVCTDSELAKTLELSPDVLEYISKLVKYSHNILYAPPRKDAGNIIDFFTVSFTRSFIVNIRPIASIFLIFFGLFLLSFLIILKNPGYAGYILPQEMIVLMKKTYSGNIARERDFFSNIVMSGYYIRNNITIGFLSFVMGVTLGLGTLAVVAYNGITLGAVFGLVVSAGYWKHLIKFVTAHSVFELTGLCLTAGAGLSMGLSILYGSDKKRSEALRDKAKEITPVLFTGALFILAAAFIEGFLSPSEADYRIKMGTAGLSAAIVLFLLLSKKLSAGINPGGGLK